MGLMGVQVLPSPWGAAGTAAVSRDGRGTRHGARQTDSWLFVKGSYELLIGRPIADRRIGAAINV
ncbi:hypothetical protein GCM10010348_19680 [Streptomyces anthocyanicus]|nr:hypothetical protein GCM10010348_19680 [Streptomyces anthocyanicus]